MIIVYHHKNKVTKITNLEGNNVFTSMVGNSVITTFFYIVNKTSCFIVWCHQNLEESLHINALASIFHHKLVMSSYTVEEEIFNKKIGYIEQSIFIKTNNKVPFSTWQMSEEVGGIHTAILQQFTHLKKDTSSLLLFLNTVAKKGVVNGLIVSLNPNLLKKFPKKNIDRLQKITTKQLFSFTKKHYKTVWVHLLLFQFIIFEKKFPFFSYLNALIFEKKDTVKISFQAIEVQSTKTKTKKEDFSVDVIIPTLKRKKHLKNVLLDLNKQTILPKKVIIVEQNPDENSVSELDYINNNWNFEIDHTFIHKLGACNARNIALSKVTSNFTFFADDDVRFNTDLLDRILYSLNKFGTDGIVMSSVQKHETLKDKRTQLSSMFGTCSSIVKSSFTNQCSYKKEHEFGYGEDSDYGMQLRNLGAEILYIPKISMLHLKAPIGGFRFTPNYPWKKDDPKPSPTVMAFYLKHHTKEQLNSYKMLLFLKFFKRQKNKNPFSYFVSMQKRWNISKQWAKKLINNEV